MEYNLRAEYHKYAWDYFVLHANQRLATFNFYLIIATLVTSGLFTTFRKEFAGPLIGLVLSILLFIFSILFWKLDHRNKMLVRNAERALKYLDKQVDFKDNDLSPNELKLFEYDDYEIEKCKSVKWYCLQSTFWSYSDCFNSVFFLFGSVGFIGIIYIIYCLI